MSIHTRSFGTTSKGERATLFSITNQNGVVLELTDYGAIWVSTKIPTKNGVTDVILGLDSAGDYEPSKGHLGGVIGRNANRISNAAFTLDGTKYQLEVTGTQPILNIHSGPNCYDRRMWDATILEKENAVRFTLNSPDGDQGFPGNLTLHVTYVLTEDNTVKLIYDGISDAKTLLNVTNHVYFNLNGHDSGTVWKHLLHVDSTRITETKSGLPTGTLLPVAGTKYDLTSMKEVEHEFDDNWCKEPHHTLDKARITCIGDKSGIRMDVYTDLPGVQIYTGNGLNVPNGKHGTSYAKGDGICFETQYYVDAINIDSPEFDKPILEANTPFHTETWYKFSTSEK